MMMERGSASRKKVDKELASGGPKKKPTRDTAQRVYLDHILTKYKCSPLEHMLRVMNNRKNPASLRLDAAKAAAPYVHARMPREHKIEGSMQHQHLHHHQHSLTDTQAWIDQVLGLADTKALEQDKETDERH